MFVGAMTLCLASVRAEAGEPSVESYVAPASCPSESSFRTTLHRLLASANADLSAVRLAVTIEQLSTEQWNAQVRVHDSDSVWTRELSASSCDTLTLAAALLIAVAIDPIAVLDAAPIELQSAEPSNEPVVSSMLPPPPVESLPPPRTPAPALRRPPSKLSTNSGLVDTNAITRQASARALGFRMGFLGFAGTGPLSGTHGGPSFDLTVSWNRVDVAASMDYLPPRLYVHDELTATSGGAQASALRLGVRGCFRHDSRAWAVPICAGVQGGMVSAEGQRLAQNDTTRAPWLGPELSIRAWYRLTSRIWLGAGATTNYAVLQPRLFIEPLTAPLSMGPRWGAYVTLGLAVAWPQKKF